MNPIINILILFFTIWMISFVIIWMALELFWNWQRWNTHRTMTNSEKWFFERKRKKDESSKHFWNAHKTMRRTMRDSEKWLNKKERKRRKNESARKANHSRSV